MIAAISGRPCGKITGSAFGWRYGAAVTDTISIELNGVPTALAPGLTLADLLAREGLLERRIAVEYNGEIVPRSAYTDVRLQAGDRLEVVHAIGGGAA